jgi:molybdate transport system substrate-binding protein
VLKKLKLSDALKDKLVYGSNVRQVLDYVSRGEVTAGVVYATDAKQAGDKVKVVATAPKDSHEPIVYPAVLVKKSRNAAAATRFLDHLGGEEARRILKERGFTPAGSEKSAEPAGRRP